jgi:hypothetical protein
MPHDPYVSTCREVFDGVPVILCSWHVKRAWLKALNEKVRDAELRLEIFKKLEAIMLHDPATGSLEDVATDVEGMIEAFFQEYQEQTAFTGYFRKTWVDNTVNKIGERFMAAATSRSCAVLNFERRESMRTLEVLYDCAYCACVRLKSTNAIHLSIVRCTEMWVHGFWRFDHAMQSGTQAMEGYHYGIKGKYVYKEKPLSGRRVDWLLHVLLEEMAPDVFFKSLEHMHGMECGGYESRGLINETACRDRLGGRPGGEA